MLRKRLLVHTSLTVLLCGITAFATASPIVAAAETAQKSRVNFTVTLTGPGNSSPADHVCIGYQYTWSASASGGTSPYTYDWEVAGTYQGTHASTMQYTFSSGGWHRVSVDVYDATLARETQAVYVFAEDGYPCVLP